MACRFAVPVLVVALGHGALARAQSDVAAPQAPDDTRARARALYDEGIGHAERRDFAAAARAFESSYELEPTRDALFGWAQAERLGGHCEKALALYDRFSTTGPSEAERQAAAIGRRRCAEALQAPRPAPPPPAAPSPPTRALWPGATLLATAGLALATGTALFVMSVEHDDRAARATRYEAYRDALDRARLERGLGFGLGGLGVVLAASGAAYLLWPTATAPRAERRTSFTFTPGPAVLGVGVGVGGLF